MTKADQFEAGVRRAETETIRCGKCQHYSGGGCLIVQGRLDAWDVCDSFSGHRPWQ